MSCVCAPENNSVRFASTPQVKQAACVRLVSLVTPAIDSRYCLARVLTDYFFFLFCFVVKRLFLFMYNAFIYAQHTTQHMNKMHLYRLFFCLKCNAGYRDQSTITKHLRTAHRMTQDFSKFYELRDTEKTPPALAARYPLDGSGVPAAPPTRPRRGRMSAQEAAAALALRQRAMGHAVTSLANVPVTSVTYRTKRTQQTSAVQPQHAQPQYGGAQYSGSAQYAAGNAQYTASSQYTSGVQYTGAPQYSGAPQYTTGQYSGAQYSGAQYAGAQSGGGSQYTTAQPSYASQDPYASALRATSTMSDSSYVTRGPNDNLSFSGP